jgi:hypothetical protein
MDATDNTHAPAPVGAFLDRSTSMNEQQRRLFDAQADHEAWSLAHEILEPWVETTKAIGSEELTQVMTKALRDVEAEVSRTLDALEPLQEAFEMSNEYLDVLRGLARSRGFSSVRAVARRAAEADPRYTVRELIESPPGGFGAAFDAVLKMNDEERKRLSDAFMRTFLNRDRLKRIEAGSA